MKKLNNKGFAIGTILYGLLIVMVLLMSLLMSTMAFGRSNSKKYVDEVIDKLEMRYDTQGRCKLASDSLQIMGLPVGVECKLYDLSNKEIESSNKYYWTRYNIYNPNNPTPELTTTPKLDATENIYLINLHVTLIPTSRKYKRATADIENIRLKKISGNIDLNGENSNTGIFKSKKECGDQYNRCDDSWIPITDKPKKDETGFLFYKVNENESLPFYVIDQEKSNGDIYLTLISAKDITQSIWYRGINIAGPIAAMNSLQKATASWNNVSQNSFNMGVDEFKNNKFTGCSDNKCTKNTYTKTFSSQNARLITVQEAMDLGCRFWNESNSHASCPFYLYNNLFSSKSYNGTSNDTTAGIGYWTMNADSEYKNNAIAIFSSGDIGGKNAHTGCYDSNECGTNEHAKGIRPVIKIKYTED